MSLHVIAYDVSDDRRRRAIARVLARFGTRVQESVFEVGVDPDELRDLRRALGPLLAQSDELAIYPIDERGDRVRVRWQRPPSSPQPVVLL